MKKQLTELEVIAKRNQKMNQKRFVLDRKYSKMLGLRKEKLEARKQKEIDRYEKKRKKLMNYEIKRMKEREKINEAKKINKAIKKGTTRKRKLRDTTKKLEKPVFVKSISKLKAKALAEIQKYCKYKRAVWSTKGPMVQLFDTMQWVKLDKKVHGGHLFPQSNYRWMMFDELNIYPISSWGNRKQLDTVGERINNIPKDNLVYIVERSKQKESIIYTRADYEAIIEKYKELNRIEEIRLGILSTKKIDAGT